MSINNKGKFAVDGRSTPVPSKEFDEEARKLHDEQLKEQLENAPSIDDAASSGKVGYIDENGNFIEDNYKIEIKDEYIQVSFRCLNNRHRDLVSKVTGSIMEFIGGYIQDYTSSVMIDGTMIPKVLRFYEEKYSEITEEIEQNNVTNKRCTYVMNFPSILFLPSTVKTFLANTQQFIDNEKTVKIYLKYLEGIKKRMVDAGKHNRFLKDGDERKKV